jgi:trk system potassium uptake protein TrkH
MNLFKRNDAFYLLAFFMIIICLGTFFLMLPISWTGAPDGSSQDFAPLKLIDALFIATSTVCVTGLSSVNTADFSRFGQIVMMLLIQIGGLGIISFTSIIMTIPGNKLPFRRVNTIRSFFVEGVEYDTRKIVSHILFYTLIIEGIGAVLLSFLFYKEGIDDWIFYGIFHAVSAFCNAGFSPLRNNLEGLANNIPILSVIMLLIIFGGIGFIVISDVSRKILRKTKRLTYHTTIVLSMTGVLLLFGTLWFLIMEWNRCFAGMSFPVALTNAAFQAVTPRTAGFDVIPQDLLSQPSKILTLVLMAFGGAPGSVAGGIKVTTIFVIIAVMLRKPDTNGDIKIRHHRLGAQTIHNATVYFLKAVALLFLLSITLSVIESANGYRLDWILFEVFSAFGTVGLTLGLTSELSVLGKWVIIGGMFAGRVGLIALAFPSARHRNYDVTYPEGTIILG